MKKTRSEPRIDFPAEEWAVRVELACAYRLFDHFGWHSLIYNHITLRIPGPQRHFLINPFGLMYREVTASNLIKVDLDGNKVSPSPWEAWEAGFVVHSAVHRVREDVLCVMHTHTAAGIAVACRGRRSRHPQGDRDIARRDRDGRPPDGLRRGGGLRRGPVECASS